MSKEFWIGLAVNIVLTLVLGVVTYMIAPVASAKLTDFLYSRRAKRSLKQKRIELAHYHRIKAFHEGTKDKQFYYVYLAALASGAFVAAAIVFLGTAMVELHAQRNTERFFIGMFGGTFFSLIGLLLITGMYTTATRLEKFDEYEKQVKTRWPDA